LAARRLAASKAAGTRIAFRESRLKEDEYIQDEVKAFLKGK